MKQYLTLSILVACSIGLASCRSKDTIPAGQTDINMSNPIDIDDLEEETSNTDMHDLAHRGEDTSLTRDVSLRVRPLNLAKVYYFDEIVKRHTHVHEAFNELMDSSFYPNVIIDFYADWCGPCKTLGSLLADIAPKNRSILIVKINIETFPSIAQQFEVRTLPTLLFFKNSSLVKRVKGFNKKELLQTIKSVF